MSVTQSEVSASISLVSGVSVVGVGMVGMGVAALSARAIREYRGSQRDRIRSKCEETEKRCYELLELLTKVGVMKNEPSKSTQDTKMYTEYCRIWSAGNMVREQGKALSTTIRLVVNDTKSDEWNIEVMGVYEEIMKTLSEMSESFRRYFSRLVETGSDWASLDNFHIIPTTKWEAALNSMAKFYSQYGKVVTISLAIASVLSFIGAVVVFCAAIIAPPVVIPIAVGAGVGLGLFSWFSSRAEKAANKRYNDAAKSYERFSQFAATLKNSPSNVNVKENLTKMLKVLQEFSDIVTPKLAVSEANCSICMDQILLRGEQESSILASSTASSSNHSVNDCNLPHSHHHIEFDDHRDQEDDGDNEEEDEDSEAVRPVTDTECKHIFHHECLTRHLSVTCDEQGMASCPECRGQFKTIAKI